MIEIVYSDEECEKLWADFDIAAFEEIFNYILVFLAKEDRKQKVVWCLSNDQNIRENNRIFRGINKATNVLSMEVMVEEYCDDGIVLYLGDIVTSYETIKREAEEQTKTFLNHLKHLFIHAVLHIFGYDHINDEEAAEMEKLEIEILRNFGISSPY